MNLHLTPAEWAAIEAAGSGVLFRAGELPYGDPCPCGRGEHPPAEFVEAAQPCHKQPPSLALEACGEAPCGGCDPHCLDGKRRVAVVVPCRVCQDLMATVPHVVAKGEHPDGLITVGHVVVTWGPLVVVGFGIDDGLGYDADYVRLSDGTKVTPPPDVDPQTLVGQYAIGVEVVP